MFSHFTTTCLFILLVVCWSFWSRRLPRLPPGPLKLPLLGNILQLPTSRLHLKLQKYALRFGPITHLKVGQQSIVVLNDESIAHEVFVKRSHAFSSRPPLHITLDLLSKGQRLGMMPYGEDWKAGRKALQAYLGPSASKKYRQLQDLESKVLLYDLLMHGHQSATPPSNEEIDAAGHGQVSDDHWFALIRRYATSVVLTIAYGQRVTKVKDSLQLHRINEVFVNFTKTAQPGSAIVDAFPILRRLPDKLAPWRKRAQLMHEWEMQLWGSLLSDLKNDMKMGKQRPASFVWDYLKERTETGFPIDLPGLGITDSTFGSENWMKDTFLTYTGAAILEAGSETVATATQTFLLFMLAYPRCFHKIREELDRFVGVDRLPSFEDEDKLPYLKACIKESARMRPVAILGSPHSCSEDQIVNGYLIPKDSVILGNVFAIHRDPKRYPDPDTFFPERFLRENSLGSWQSGPEKERDHYIFGWGRRFCPGSHITEASLFITLSRIIWGLDIEPARDPVTQHLVVPNVLDERESFTGGLATGPKLFGMGFQPRSKRHVELIASSFEECQPQWNNLGLEEDER